MTLLESLHGSRIHLSGTFVRTEDRWNDYLRRPVQRVILKQIRDESGALVSDRQSFCLGKGFRALGKIQPGEIISFLASVVSQGNAYKLSRPAKIKRGNCDTIQTQLC